MREIHQPLQLLVLGRDISTEICGMRHGMNGMGGVLLVRLPLQIFFSLASCSDDVSRATLRYCLLGYLGDPLVLSFVFQKGGSRSPHRWSSRTDGSGQEPQYLGGLNNCDTEGRGSDDAGGGLSALSLSSTSSTSSSFSESAALSSSNEGNWLADRRC